MTFRSNKHIGVGGGFNSLSSLRSSLHSDLEIIVNTFDFEYAFSSENINITGTTTTMFDYKGESQRNMSNVGSSNQPTYLSSNSNFGGKPTLTFDGLSQYLINPVFNGSQPLSTEGCFVIVGDAPAGVNNYIPAVKYGHNVTTNIFGPSWYNRSGLANPSIKRGGLTMDVRTDMVADTSPHIFSIASNGVDSTTVFKTAVKGGITSHLGYPEGTWLDTLALGNRHLSVGATINGGVASNFVAGNIAFAGYMNNFLDADIIDLHTQLKNYYGI